MRFEDLAARALETATSQGAEYADVRFEDARNERIDIRNGDAIAVRDDRSLGYGVRALVDGTWGFASSDDLSSAGLDVAAARAVEIAKASAAVGVERIGAAPTDAHAGTFVTECEKDPDDVALEERVEMLVGAEYALHVDPRIRTGRARLDVWRTKKEFFSTIGSRIEQDIRQIGSSIHVLAVGGGDAQDRGWPGDRGLYLTGGWEVVERAGLVDNAVRIAEEAIALLEAPQAPSGTTDIVLGGSQVSLQIHESCGHAAELDRVLGWEANFSGTSFLDPNELGSLRYGSPLVTIVIDNTLPNGFATCGYDDEGSPSGVSDIVRDGILAGFEMSRDTARRIGRETNACVRAQSWEHVPMIRMCNLNLLPGTHSFEQLIGEVDEGIYMESNRSWSIDDKRLNFQFGCQIGWEIKRGKLGRVVKNPTYAGVTPQFWGSCDAIGDAASWVPWGTPNCGKGEPLQVGRTTQAAAPARFRNVRVGVGYS
ncbi:MAG: TldD/PmbA family protein [Candidatus Eremiobacteraeota bacterium]|nr:TldD/PmbA family protein [Candidatus Eremiobacteraeota bacterium]